MMEPGPVVGWRLANEDALSTGSGSSDPERTLTSASVSSESMLLQRNRSTIIRGVGTSQPKRKAVIFTLVGSVMLIIGSVFGTLYFTSNDSDGGVSNGLKNTELDHDIFVRDITSAESPENMQMQSDSPLQPSEPQALIQNSESNSTIAATSTTRTTTTRNRKRNRNRGNNRHGPRILPVDAQDKAPFSLLYQMRLVDGKQETFTNYTECKDVDLDGKISFKGWKANILVNLTRAGITDDHPNNFTGYGTTKSDARRRAAENAFTVLYPAKLNYPGRNDCSEIDDFCQT